MNIENAQKAVDDWINEHGVRYFNELTNMAQLTEEVGEVARIIARRYGEQSEKDVLRMEVVVDDAGVDVQQLVQGGVQQVDAYVNLLQIHLPCARSDHLAFCSYFISTW